LDGSLIIGGDVGELNRILTLQRPFGPPDTETVVNAGIDGAEELFDRSNLIYARAVNPLRPTYIVGRKGAGKTAFLLSSTLRGGPSTEVLRTATVYHEMAAVLRRYRAIRGPLFVEQVAQIWLALFEQVAVYHAVRHAAPGDAPNDLQVLWDFRGPARVAPDDATRIAERFLAELQRRIADDGLVGLREVLDGPAHGEATGCRVRQAMAAVLAARPDPLVIVMDNLEDLHEQLSELHQVLAGMFAAAGRVIADNQNCRPFGLQICLPSELFDQIHEISAAPEKDFRLSYLTIYWTAKELLKLAGNRLFLFLKTHHPDRLDGVLRRADQLDEPEPMIGLLRTALPNSVHNGLGMPEDPVAYLLRHTQLLPRHLIEILNSVFTTRARDSVPWAVSPAAVAVGTRAAERLIVKGVFAAHRASFPFAGDALIRLSDALPICFPAKELRKVFNRKGIRKITGMDFDEFLSMLITLGVVGVRFDQTARYNKAHFQYTFDSVLTAEEDVDHLCFHPLFTRYLHERSLPRLGRTGALATYPHGCDPADEDYRIPLGYAEALRRS
jgi:hypothetical protein